MVCSLCRFLILQSQTFFDVFLVCASESCCFFPPSPRLKTETHKTMVTYCVLFFVRGPLTVTRRRGILRSAGRQKYCDGSLLRASIGLMLHFHTHFDLISFCLLFGQGWIFIFLANVPLGPFCAVTSV